MTPVLRYLLSYVQIGCLVVVLARLSRGANRIDALEPIDASCDVTIVIPARNEALRIRPLLDSLRRTYPDARVLVVNDESTDETAAIANEYGATVIPGSEPPPGWVGKPWALQQGLNAVATEFVVFLDADVTVSAGLIGALAAAKAHHGYDIVSAAARVRSESVASQLHSAAMRTTLVYRFGPVGQAALPKVDRTFISGQCVFGEAQYIREIGGFSLAYGKMTDDIAFGRAAVVHGAKVAYLDGTSLLEDGAPSSVRETWRQFGRTIGLRDVSPFRMQLTDLVVIWATVVVPQVRFATNAFTFADIACVAVRLLVLVAMRTSNSKPRRFIILSPLCDVPAAVRLTWSFLRPSRQWRGRRYDFRPTTTAQPSA